MFYARNSNNVFFILPTLAVGVDIDGTYFMEFGWLNFAIGLGAKPNYMDDRDDQ